MSDEEIKDLEINNLSEEEQKEFIKRAESCVFRLNANEYYRMKEFTKAHRDCRIDKATGRHKFGTIGGGTSISFMGTGLGNIVTIKCHGCGTEIDITDESCW